MKDDYQDKVVLPEIKRKQEILRLRKHQISARVDLASVKSHEVSYTKHID